MHRTTSAARRGLFLVLAAAVLWGTGGLVATLAYDRTDLTAIDVATWRLLVAAVAGVPLVRRFGSGASGRQRLLGARPLGAVVVGAGLAWYQVSYFAAVERAGVSLSTFIALGAAPVLVAVAEAVLHRRRPSTVVLVALALALSGLVLLAGGPVELAGPGRGGDVVLGGLLALGSAAGYAAVTVVSSRVRGDDDPRAFAARTFAVGALALLPVALVGGGLDVPLDGAAAGALVYLGVGPTAGAYAMFFAGLGSVRASAASIATLVEPLTAALLAAAVLGERLSARGLSGAALLVGAVVLLVVRPAPHDAPTHVPQPRGRLPQPRHGSM